MRSKQQRLFLITLAALSLTMTGCAALSSWWPWGDNDARVTQIALSSPEANRLPGITSGDNLSHVLALLGPPQIRWTPAGYPAAGGRWEWISPEHDFSTALLQYRHRMIEFDGRGKVSSVREWYTKEPPGAVADVSLQQEALPPALSRPPVSSTAPAERQAASLGPPPLPGLSELLKTLPDLPSPGFAPRSGEAAPQPPQASTPPTPLTPDPPPAQPGSQAEIGPVVGAEPQSLKGEGPRADK